MNKTSPTAAHWYVLGAGAIGCLWAAYLRKAGHQVTLIQRQSVPYNKTKLTLESTDGHIEHFELGISDASTLKSQVGLIDHLLVCTKAHQTIAAIEQLRPAIGDKATVLLLQNGMGIQQQSQQRLKDTNLVYAAVSTDGAWKRGALHVVHAGKGESKLAMISTINKSAKHDDEQALMKQLGSIELNVLVSKDITLELVKKLAINCAINPLSALHRCRNGDLNHNHDYAQEVALLCTEIQDIINAMGYHTALPNIHSLAVQVIQQTADNLSSMHQDLAAGRPSEIEYITGYLVTQARQLGIACPLNQNLLTRVRRSETNSAGPGPL